MHNSKYKLLFIYLLGCFLGFAQKSEVYNYKNLAFDKAIVLYKERQYLTAQLLFEQIIQQNTDQVDTADCAFYIACCAIKLDQTNADDMLENFTANYPTSTKQNSAFAVVADYYFEHENYVKALLYFEKIEQSEMSLSEIEQLNFQKAYCFFVKNDKKQALINFNKVINSLKFGSQAKYYLGFIAYEKDDYQEASKQFEQINDQDKYREKMSYFEADMNFKLGNFKKATDLATKALLKSSSIEQSELNKIIGESYFNLKEYNKALPFLLNYKGKNGKWNNTDYYQLGYAYYKQNDFLNAIAQFNKICDGKDFVAQNAFYHLAESYLKLDKKQEALNAFKSASELKFDLKIQEDALLNYAKLSYDVGNSYQSVPDILTNFLLKYPKSESKNSIEALLINSYVTSKNYQQALALLEKNKSSQNQVLYQKVSFLYGLALFTDENYSAAKVFFQKATQPTNTAIGIRANFWKGETEFILNDFDGAIESFKKVDSANLKENLSDLKNINYSLAYCYFKIKQYENAASYFQKQIDFNANDTARLTDSYLRLGDCQFVTFNYLMAIASYDKSLKYKGLKDDYAQFQKAILHGFVGRNDKKIDELNIFIQNYNLSPYIDDAYFELANTYVVLNKSDLALKTYDKLILLGKSVFNSKALLKQGLLYYNNQNDELALEKFKKVAVDFPNSPEAFEAIASAKLIYLDNAKVTEYAAWAKSLGYMQIDNNELDKDSYEQAYKAYQQANSKQAITLLTDYIAKFSKGFYVLQANYYLADLYYKNEAEVKSITNFKYVINQPKNEFTEQSLLKLSTFYLKANDFEAAILILKRLEAESEQAQNSTFSQANLMRAFYENKDYPNAQIYAEKVKSNSKIEAKIKTDAQIITARCAIKFNDDLKAKMAYQIVLTSAQGELAAEALYYDSYFKNKEGKYLESNKVIQKLAKAYSNYKFYGAKGLIIMAKNYYQLNDVFQSTSILESVIENFTNFNDVVQEAKAELDKIKVAESKTNSSIIK